MSQLLTLTKDRPAWVKLEILIFSSSSANPTKWSNILKQFVGKLHCRRTVWVCLTILWGWHLKDLISWKTLDFQIAQFFLYRDQDFTASTNFILNSIIEYILATKTSDKLVFLQWSPLRIMCFFYLFMILGSSFYRHNIFNIYSFTLVFNLNIISQAQ